MIQVLIQSTFGTVTTMMETLPTVGDRVRATIQEPDREPLPVIGTVKARTWEERPAGPAIHRGEALPPHQPTTWVCVLDLDRAQPDVRRRS